VVPQFAVPRRVSEQEAARTLKGRVAGGAVVRGGGYVGGWEERGGRGGGGGGVCLGNGGTFGLGDY
jgi:hypothetical protein